MSGDPGSKWRIGALIALAILAAGVIASFVWPRDDDGVRALPTGPAPPCPFGYVDHVGRGELILARLRETREGAPIVHALGEAEVRFCFGDIAVPVVSDGRLLLLDRGDDDVSLTARAGHLLVHVVEGPPVPDEIPRGADCDAIVERALHREAHAHAVELRLRRELGATEPRYEFENAYWARSDEDVVFDYLVAHPDGGRGIDALATAYRQRCERAVGTLRPRR